MARTREAALHPDVGPEAEDDVAPVTDDGGPIVAGGPIPAVSHGDGDGDGGGGGGAPSASELAFGGGGGGRAAAGSGGGGGSGAGGGAGGQGLPDGVRGQFEASLGLDLTDVQVHTDAGAAATANAVGARAVAIGQDIYFAAGQYDPASHAGQELLAHEVAHTAQQRSASPQAQPKAAVAPATHGAEGEADRAASAMVAGQPATVTPIGEAAAFAKEYTRDELLAAYRGALARMDWTDVALRLNGFADGDIAMLVGKMSFGQLTHTREAALAAMPGWSDRVTTAIDAVDANAQKVAALYAAYEKAVKAAQAGGSWTEVADRLNGMGDWDIQDRLKRFTWFELMAIRDATTNQRVIAHVDKADTARVQRTQAAYKDAVNSQNWARVAQLLNAFDTAGIESSIRELADKNLKHLRFLKSEAIRIMPDHHERVTSVIDAVAREHGEEPPQPIPYVAHVEIPDVSDDTRPMAGTDLSNFAGNTKVATFAAELAASAAARLADKPVKKGASAPTAESEQARLEKSFRETGAPDKMGREPSLPTVGVYARKWMSEMREGVDSRANAGGWRNLKAPGFDAAALETLAGGGSNGGQKVHPIVNKVLGNLGSDFNATTYANHGGAAFAPFCVDVKPAIKTDDRGLYQREQMVEFIERINAAVGSASADWAGLYNDATVTAAANERLGVKRITHAGDDGTRNWHGALNLHIHLYIIPGDGTPVPGSADKGPAVNPAAE
jgi:hypothetical protein